MGTESHAISFEDLGKMTNRELMEVIIWPPGTCKDQQVSNRLNAIATRTSREKLSINECMVIYAFDSTWGLDLLDEYWNYKPRAFTSHDLWTVLRSLYLNDPNNVAVSALMHIMLNRCARMPRSYIRRMVDMLAETSGFVPARHIDLLEAFRAYLRQIPTRAKEKEWLQRRHPIIFDFITQ